jgi:hypothetical protein
MNSSLKLDWCSFEAAKHAVLKWHYSHAMPSGKLTKIGVWEHGKFIGCVLFGRGANNSLGKPYGLSQLECCELVRIALTKHEAPVTRIVSIAIKMLRKLSPGLKLIVSFADTEQDHHGGIYQGGNWVYIGQSKPADEYLVRGKRMHGRSMRASYGTHIGKDFIKIVKGSTKHRYVMPLDEETKQQVLKLSKAYPKRAKQATGATSLKAEVQRLPARSNNSEKLNKHEKVEHYGVEQQQ